MELVATVAAGAPSIWTRIVHPVTALWQKRAPRQLRVIETLSLGEKRQLLIVEWQNRRMLIGAAGSFLTTLAEAKEAETGHVRD